MQVGDLPLVFELSGIHTPPKGGGERGYAITLLTLLACVPIRMPEDEGEETLESPRGRARGGLQKSRLVHPPSRRASRTVLEELHLADRKADREVRWKVWPLGNRSPTPPLEVCRHCRMWGTTKYPMRPARRLGTRTRYPL